MAKLEKLENNMVKLTIEVSAERFDTALQETYIKTGKRYSIPGFRKGKLAPRKVIENYYGPGAFFEDAFEAVYAKAYDETIDEQGLHPVSHPDVEIEQIEVGKPLIFTAKVTLKPEVALGAYKGIEVPKAEYTVTDSDVDAEIDKVRERNARFVDVERPVAMGDRVVIDYSGSIDGVAFDGGTAESQTLEIGSGRFIPGFEEQLVGMALEEERDINVSFPEEYHAEDLKGKEAVFHIRLHEIKQKELSEVDDEFAKDVSEFDTLADYKADIRAKLEETAQNRAREEMLSAALETAVENAGVEIPDVMIERQIGHMLQDLEMRLRYQGMNLEDYCKYTDTSMQSLRDEMRDEAGKRVKTQLVLEAIHAKEDIKCSDEEVDAELTKIAERAKKTLEEYKEGLREGELEYIRDEIETRKTVDLLLESAKLVKPDKKSKKKSDKE